MKLEGEIGEINVIERLVELGREGFTGAVRFENDGIIKIIYFKGGDVLSASTNDRSDSVDEILLRAGKVTREHVKQALAKRKETETLGDALLALGFITRKELTWARRVQVIGAIRSIDAWPAGSYTIVADYLPKREEGTIFPLNQLIVELIVTDPDRTKFERSLEGGSTVLVPGPDFHEAFGRLGLNQDAADIVSHLDGVSSAADIAVASGKDAFNVYKLLQALLTLGLVTRRQAAAAAIPAPIDIPEPAPDLDFANSDVLNADQTWRIAPDMVKARAASPVAWPPPGLGEAASSPSPAESFAPAAPSFPMVDSSPAPLPATEEISSWEIEEAPGDATSVLPGGWAPSPPPAPPASSWAPEPEPGPAVEETPAEPQWGFDEAQIEAARRADVPMTWEDETPAEDAGTPQEEPVSKPARRGGMLAAVAAIALLLLGAGGWFGWSWWQGQSVDPDPAPVVRAQPRPPAPAASDPGTVVPVGGPAATAAGTVSPAATDTTPVQAPATTTVATPAKAAALPQPVPPGPAPVTRAERGAAGTTITNVAKTPPATAAEPDRARYDQMAAQFAANPSGNFTVQFALVCRTPSVSRSLREGGEKVWFVPTQFRGQGCYRVFWGRYGTREEAQRGMEEIPASLREGAKPAVVSVPR